MIENDAGTQAESPEPLPRILSIKEIVEAVSQHTGVSIDDLYSPKRERRIARPRQYAMRLAVELTTKPLPDIGRRIGDRDHTTVIHGSKAIARLELEDGDIRSDIVALRTLFDPDGTLARMVKERRDRRSGLSMKRRKSVSTA